MKKKVLWLVVARSGSKSIPNKNVKLLGHYPLLSYRIRTAINSEFENDLWISTDSREYADIAQHYGAFVPFLRPFDLSSDSSSSMDVVLHAMTFANNLGNQYDYIALLEPTSPFITTTHLDDAINKLDQELEASSIVAVKESRPNRLFIQEEDKYLTTLSANIKEIKTLGRQAFKKEITPSGGFYISRWNDFLVNQTFYNHNTMSYEVDEISSLEIDEPIDWLFANFVLEKNLLDITNLFQDYESGV